MRIAFLGTPAFAVPSLEALAREGFEIPAVFTQPDRPKGRGQQLAISPVKEAALRLGLAVHQPERVRRPEVLELLRGMALEAMVVVVTWFGRPCEGPIPPDAYTQTGYGEQWIPRISVCAEKK